MEKKNSIIIINTDSLVIINCIYSSFFSILYYAMILFFGVKYEILIEICFSCFRFITYQMNKKVLDCTE